MALLLTHNVGFCFEFWKRQVRGWTGRSRVHFASARCHFGVFPRRAKWQGTKQGQAQGQGCWSSVQCAARAFGRRPLPEVDLAYLGEVWACGTVGRTLVIGASTPEETFFDSASVASWPPHASLLAVVEVVNLLPDQLILHCQAKERDLHPQVLQGNVSAHFNWDFYPKIWFGRTKYFCNFKWAAASKWQLLPVGTEQ